MVQSRHLTVLSIITLVFLSILSKCNSYPYFDELPISERPTKVYIQAPFDRHINRVKQYYDTMAQLKNWRRNIDEWNGDDDGAWSDAFLPYNNLNYKR